jgi:hypothetical protein
MSQWYHPTNIDLDIWDPLNHEHWLVDQESIDHIKINSPYVLYWKIDQEKTEMNNDEISNLYQESDQLVFYNSEPIRIYVYVEISPIVQELSRIGVSELREINFITNKTDLIEKIGRFPLPGDLLSISYFEKDKKKTQSFYNLVSTSDADLHLYRYVHFILNCEQSNLSNIPKHIFDYQFKEY